MNTTFINQNGENNIVEAGKKHLKSRSEDLQYYSIFGYCEDETDFVNTLKEQDFDVDEIQTSCDNFKSLSLFHEYGLSFDYVELGTFYDQTEDYFRFQFSWGGPSEEVRFYEDGTIIFVYLDWFSGVGFDVSYEDEFVWLCDNFKDTDSMNFEREREKYDYYEKLYELEEN